MTPDLMAKLDQIESEMRRIGFWDDNPPDLLAKFSSGEMRTYLDAPTFELWLQVVFLHRAREAVSTNKLPSSSQVGQMAMKQYNYHSVVEEAQGLMKLLYEFDEMVCNQA
jgi:uncharacterized protein YqcC (DUF446 family)